MKKFLKTITMALVFCLSLTALVACGSESLNSQTQDSSVDVDSGYQDPTVDTPPTGNKQGCDTDCDCQSPVVCDHIICEHEWEVWFTTEQDGKLVTFSRCGKNPEHLKYEVTDKPADPEPEPEPEPEIIFDAAYLCNNSWQTNDSDQIPLIFTENTYQFGRNITSSWHIEGDTVYLQSNQNNTYYYTLTFDRTTQTLSGNLFGDYYTFVLAQSVVK